MTPAFKHPSTAAFYGLLLLGFALRMAYVGSAGYHLDSDHSIVYLMARNVVDGEIPAFFWGQSYGGTALQVTAGFAMFLFGKSILVLTIVSAIFWAIAAVLVRLIVMRALNRRAGDLAGVLSWFPGAAILGTSVTEPGFYGPSLVFGLGAIWTVQRWWKQMNPGSWVLLGALSGLALWTSPMAVALAAPALFSAVWTNRHWRHWLIGAGVAVVAATPWLLETVRSSLSSVRPLGGASNLHIESFASIFTTMFPASFPLGDQELPRFLMALAIVGALLFVTVRGFRQANVGAALLGAGTSIVVVVLVLGSGVRLAADSARYSAFLIPVAAFAIAWLTTRMRAVTWGLLVGAPVITFLLVLSGTDGLRQDTSSRFDPTYNRIAAHLSNEGIEAGYGSYWMAYAFSAANDEEITLASLVPRRYPAYERAAASEERTAIVVYAGNANDTLLQTEPELPPFSRTEIGGYAVFLFDEGVNPYELELSLF